jgi:hypothetical protein
MNFLAVPYKVVIRPESRDKGPIFEFPDSKFPFRHALSGCDLISVHWSRFLADWFCL